MKISVNAPSYKRSGAVDTLKYIPYCKIWVDKSEYDDYKKNYPDAEIVCCPEGIQGNVCRVRNYILDTEYKNGIDVVVIIDDDLQSLGYFEKGKANDLSTSEIMGFIEKYSVMAVDLGAKLWGVNVNPDKQGYREYNPFSTISFVGCPFMAHIKTDLRFDESLPLKEDYDFTLQNLNKYRIALRVNKFYYKTKQAEQVGGCATYRNIEREKEQFLLLQKKWGSSIIKRDKKDRSNKSDKKKNYDINPILSVPIKGI